MLGFVLLLFLRCDPTHVARFIDSVCARITGCASPERYDRLKWWCDTLWMMLAALFSGTVIAMLALTAWVELGFFWAAQSRECADGPGLGLLLNFVVLPLRIMVLGSFGVQYADPCSTASALPLESLL